MTKYREILRLTALGFSQRDICSSAGVSQKTVSKVQKRARELQLAWPLDESMTDIALSKLMFPHEAALTNKRMPDFKYVRKELQRNGVTKKLLWTEYLEECRQTGDEPLKLTLCPKPDRALGFAKAEWRSPAGTIQSAWEYRDGKLCFDFSLPIPATITLPNGKQYAAQAGEVHDAILL